MIKTLIFTIWCSLILVAVAGENASVVPIVELEGVTPKREVLNLSGRKKPLILKTEKEAAAQFSAEEFAKVKTKVDFTTQYLAIIAWKGSGQDKLTLSKDASNPEKIVIESKMGRTRDMKAHLKVFVISQRMKFQPNE